MSSADYLFSELEPRWRGYWEQQGLHRAVEQDPRPKYYCLDMFPYPSGSGLHVGHWRGYVLSDVWSRYQTLKGFKVLHPMGWDAFGLPAENDAIKKKTHPRINTEKNISNIRRQIKEIGAMVDWSRELNTTDPEFYRWTQWIFLQFYKKGLAYRKLMPIHWCPSCRVGLANEEVVGKLCERCDTEVIQKELKQWMLKITAYAERLLNDLEPLQWPEKVKLMQANWIGRSEGAEVVFDVIDASGRAHPVTIYTTRPDTLFGATYMVLAPEHPFVLKICDPRRRKEVERYVKKAGQKKEIDRTSSELPVSGVDLGIMAINPVNQKKMPVWISDYVLMGYGTGAIMAVPAHDERDYRFAKAFHIPIVQVIDAPEADITKGAYSGEGTLIHSGAFNGEPSQTARKKITEQLAKSKRAQFAVHYKLRDWVFSRQRYWGEPIPIIYCDACGELPLREEDLPLRLPEIKSYQPTGTGESPLAAVLDWVRTTCHQCGGPARRETDTMPQWAGSSWYFLRYVSPKNAKEPWDPKALKHWMPVDQYVGGVEHAILHLLYARFFVKVLYDLKQVPFAEPFKRLFNQGMVCRKSERTGKIEKMSKSKQNVVNPDELVQKYGTDTVRLFELFIGPPEQDAEWHDRGIAGTFKFLKRAWNWVLTSQERLSESADPSMERQRHTLIKKVTERLEAFRFNVVVSAFMEFMNAVGSPQHQSKAVSRAVLDDFLILLSPLAPHIAEELWQRTGHEPSIFRARWPQWDSQWLATEKMALVVQVNGRLRANIEVDPGLSVDEIKHLARDHDNVKRHLEGKKIIKEIYVPKRLINFVVR